MISLTTIKTIKKELGWVVTKPKYCQLIRTANLLKLILNLLKLILLLKS